MPINVVTTAELERTCPCQEFSLIKFDFLSLTISEKIRVHDEPPEPLRVIPMSV